MAGGGYPGFQVDPGQVAKSGRSACELAQALSQVRTGWANATDDTHDACGFKETSEQFAGMQDRWFDELGVYIRVLEELCQAIQAAAGGYQTSDTQAADDLRGRV